MQGISAGGVSLRFESATVLTVDFAGREANRPKRLLVRVVRVRR